MRGVIGHGPIGIKLENWFRCFFFIRV